MAVGGQVNRLQLVSQLDVTVRRYLEAEQIIIKQAQRTQADTGRTGHSGIGT